MRDIVPGHRALTCNLTYSRHLSVHQKKERQDTKAIGLKQHEELHKTQVSQASGAAAGDNQMIKQGDI